MAGLSRRERLSPVDAAWFRMDTPTNMAMITGVMMFSEPLDVWRLKQVVEYRLLQHDRFRQRIHQPLLGVRRPSWELDPHFDLNAHIRHIALPAPGDVNALQALVGDLMGTPLDPTKPLWQLHVVDNFNGGSALICRLHHCHRGWPGVGPGAFWRRPIWSRTRPCWRRKTRFGATAGCWTNC